MNRIFKEILDEEMEAARKELDRKASTDSIFKDVEQWVRDVGGPEKIQKGRGFNDKEVAKATGHSEEEVHKALHDYSQIVQDAMTRAMVRSQKLGLGS